MVRKLVDVTVRCDALAPAVVREALDGLPDITGSQADDVKLVASELVTNAVRHSLCQEDELINVSATRDGRLRIAVLDPGASGGRATVSDRPHAMGGMGLKVVEMLACRWGSDRRRDGYEVWAELDLAAA